jgi:hypothetical protein
MTADLRCTSLEKVRIASISEIRVIRGVTESDQTSCRNFLSYIFLSASLVAASRSSISANR